MTASSFRRARCSVLLVVSLTLQLACGPQQLPANQVPGQEAVVVAVIDGDTIDVRLPDGKIHSVRYIGIDTPEPRHPTRGVDCWATEATARNRELVLGQTVRLERDVSDTDRFDRMLRYVWLGDQLIEATLLAEGHARAVRYRPDTSRADAFAKIESEAKAERRGLWAAC